MEKISCVELNIQNSTIYNNLQNIISKTLIIEDGKCIDLPEQDKQDNHLFFQYATNIDNCYYLKYNDTKSPLKSQLERSFFNNSISMYKHKLKFIKPFSINIKNRTELISVIQANYTPLHNFNIDNDVYDMIFNFTIFEYTSGTNKLNKFIERFNRSDIERYKDLIIIQFMIYNLYGIVVLNDFDLTFDNYYKNSSIYKDIPNITELPNMVNTCPDIKQQNIIFKDYMLRVSSSKFKQPMELKTINFLNGGDCES